MNYQEAVDIIFQGVINLAAKDTDKAVKHLMEHFALEEDDKSGVRFSDYFLDAYKALDNDDRRVMGETVAATLERVCDFLSPGGEIPERLSAFFKFVSDTTPPEAKPTLDKLIDGQKVLEASPCLHAWMLATLIDYQNGLSSDLCRDFRFWEKQRKLLAMKKTDGISLIWGGMLQRDFVKAMDKFPEFATNKDSARDLIVNFPWVTDKFFGKNSANFRLAIDLAFSHSGKPMSPAVRKELDNYFNGISELKAGCPSPKP